MQDVVCDIDQTSRTRCRSLHLPPCLVSSRTKTRGTGCKLLRYCVSIMRLRPITDQSTKLTCPLLGLTKVARVTFLALYSVSKRKVLRLRDGLMDSGFHVFCCPLLSLCTLVVTEGIKTAEILIPRLLDGEQPLKKCGISRSLQMSMFPTHTWSACRPRPFLGVLPQSLSCSLVL